MLRNLFIFVFLVIIESSSERPLLNISTTACPLLRSTDQVKVFITVSSLTIDTTADGIVKRQLEVNWLSPNTSPGDVVGIYEQDPKLNSSAVPLTAVDPTQHPGGYFRSNVELSVIFFNLSCLSQDPCLGYWAAYHNKEGKILSSSCLQTRPFWMEENKKYLSNFTLSEIMIPGSHDSGSFYFHKERALLSKYKYAQDEPIFNQLVYGLRYFDLRIGYYENTKDRYYINHNFLRTKHSVKSVLHEVLQFIKATKEIVILDFHNFPVGFKQKAVHFPLMHLIFRTLGNYLIPTEDHFGNATFSALWEENKRILVSYDNDVRFLFYNKVFWPSIPRAWGNKQHPEDLKEYFEEVFRKPAPKGIWASMAELTPNARTIVLHPESGLRIFADEVNKNVTHWFRDLYWQKANIVATDYFLGNNIIDVAIETNKIKALCPRSSWT